MRFGNSGFVFILCLIVGAVLSETSSSGYQPREPSLHRKPDEDSCLLDNRSERWRSWVMSRQGSIEEPIVISSSESDDEDVVLRSVPNSPVKLVDSSRYR